jgi:hypothetical protein
VGKADWISGIEKPLRFNYLACFPTILGKVMIVSTGQLGYACFPQEFYTYILCQIIIYH